MKVFVTGASGFIGSALIPELLKAGHQVLGLARSEESAKKLTEAGAEVHRGALDDLDSLTSGAKAADAVIHLGFIHDFTIFAAASETDRRAIEALGDALAGTNRPLVTTSGVMGLNAPDRLATEQDKHLPVSPRVTDTTTQAQVAKGVRASVVRLAPLVHDASYCGFVDLFAQAARRTGTVVYVGDGNNRWSALHRLDAARLFHLVLEQGVAGASYHGVAEEGIPVREIMTAVGQELNLPVASKSPEEAPQFLGPIAGFVAMDAPSSSALTQQQLGWHPTQPGLLADIKQGQYLQG
ncbi:SDR family oxidoreductase [Hymenobacter psoromatis]|uniref:SDR family oxidoreductase n=1 Tax=Hymenobacter psoromatis TaxID=1484116 RepID=UPI001CBB2C36|nr:SDR family oxidoreductase [Hymenobacter psoromatis]